MLVAAHCTPVNLNVVSKDIVIMSFSHSLVTVDLYSAGSGREEIWKLWSTACRGGLINFSESKSLVNRSFNHNHICIIYHLIIGAKGNPQTVMCSYTTQIVLLLPIPNITVSLAIFIYILSPVLPRPPGGMGTSWKQRSFFQNSLGLFSLPVTWSGLVESGASSENPSSKWIKC